MMPNWRSMPNSLACTSPRLSFRRRRDICRCRRSRTACRLFQVGPEKGVEPSVYLASSPEAEGVSGRYFAKNIFYRHIMEETRPSKATRDEAAQERLREESERLTGLARSGASTTWRRRKIATRNQRQRGTEE
jgi:hypothetical protein